MTIIIEGLDGSGKTTLANSYIGLNYIGFPSDPEIKEALLKRKYGFRDIISLIVDDMLSHNLSNCVVDRWIYSTIVYQSEDFNMGVAETMVKIQSIIGAELFNMMVYEVGEIHFLDTPFNVCKDRIAKRGEVNRYDTVFAGVHAQRRDKYYEIFDKVIANSNTEVRVIEQEDIC